jgi:predicted dehydrogenase
MTNGAVRTAVVGLGPHGLRHLHACCQVEGVQVVAVCDVREEAVTNATKIAPEALVFTSWQEMLATVKPDLVNIVTNGPSHAEITLKAAATGARYILCEKPMATSVRDARAMIDACRTSGTRLAIAHARRWVKSYQQLKSLIAEGTVGRLCHFSSVLGGGLFAGNGTHTMDLARMLSGADAISVTAFVDQTKSKNPRGEQFSDPGALGVYWFDNGMRLIIDMFEDLGVATPMDIVGTIGHIRIDEPANEWTLRARQGADREEPVSKYWLPLASIPFEPEPLNMITMLAAGIRELISEEPILCTGDDGLAALEMVIGAHVSNTLGNQPVSLPLSQEYYDIDIPLT